MDKSLERRKRGLKTGEGWRKKGCERHWVHTSSSAPVTLPGHALLVFSRAQWDLRDVNETRTRSENTLCVNKPRCHHFSSCTRMMTLSNNWSGSLSLLGSLRDSETMALIAQSLLFLSHDSVNMPLLFPRLLCNYPHINRLLHLIKPSVQGKRPVQKMTDAPFLVPDG